MKIIHVTHSFFPYSYGGRERMVLEWCRCASKRNDVTILTSSDNPFKFEMRELSKINICYLPSITINLISSIYRIPPFVPFFLLLKDFDVCHVHDFHHFTTLLSVLACKIKRKPIILSYHGINKFGSVVSFLTKVYEILFLKLIVNSAKKVIVPSEFSKREVIEKYGVPEKKVVKIPNFINIDKLRATINFKRKYGLKRYILAVGRFSKEKGFEYLLKSFKMVSEKDKNVKLVIVGGKRSYMRIISNMVRALGLEDRVLLLSNISDNEIYSAFKGTKLVVIPSIYEPFGIVALEAMHFGKPIVAFRVGGLKEIVKNGVNGVLVKERGVEELSKAIIRILSDNRLRRKLEKNGKVLVKKFDSRNFVDQINNFYEWIKRKL